MALVMVQWIEPPPSDHHHTRAPETVLRRRATRLERTLHLVCGGRAHLAQLAEHDFAAGASAAEAEAEKKKTAAAETAAADWRKR